MATKTKKPLAKVKIARLEFQLTEARRRIEQLEAQKSRPVIAMAQIDRLIGELSWDGKWEPPINYEKWQSIIKHLVSARNLLDQVVS